MSCPKLTGTDFSNLLQNTQHIKNWSFSLTNDSKVTVADPKTISISNKSSPKTDGTCEYEVMKHKVSYYGPSAPPELIPTQVYFTLKRERAFCPSITTDTLRHLQNGEAFHIKDPKNRAQPDGVILKAIDENSAKNIALALKGLPDKNFTKGRTETAQTRGSFSDVCTYQVDSNGIQEIWVTAHLQD
ncbi:MAG: hypothetical protein K2X53_02340 [Alphaproteobacteria bacterium]|nr:hypothetical protein [Alphaproteobacteria bacterium]